MSWLVTGAHGFLGLAILAAIAKARPQEAILACDIVEPAPQERAWLARHTPDARSLALDAADPAAVLAAVQAHRPARVIHAAALTPSLAPGPEEAARVMRVNAGGSFAMIRACLRVPPERLVLLSSAGVYADQPGDIRREDESFALPDGPYRASKCAVEEAARVWGAELDILTLRPGAIYGPTERVRATRPRMSLIGRMAQALAEGRPFGLAAPGAGRDWTHAEDAAEAIVALALTPAPSARVFNITSGVRSTNAELAAAFAPHGLRVIWEDRPPEKHEADCATHSAERLRRQTGLIPRHDLTRGVASLVGGAG